MVEVRSHQVFRSAGRTAATAAVLLVAVLAVPGHADAAGVVKAKAAKTESVTSGKWTATLSTTTMTFTTSANQTSTVTNTGTVALSGISYKVTVSNPVSGSPSFTLFVCAVAWSSGTCAGGAGTQVGGTFSVNSTTTVSSTVVPAVAGSVYLQVEPASVTSSTVVTLGTSITSSTQLRAAMKTNQ
jgi:hypothetical protein